jgi:hypothetical protein
MNAVDRSFSPAPSRLRPADHITRAAAAHVAYQANFGRYKSAEDAARQLFGDDKVTDIVLRAATSPAMVGTSGWASQLAQTAVADFVVGLAPLSAAAELIRRALKVNLDGVGSVTIPQRKIVAGDAGGFVGEGQPITTRQLNVLGGPSLSPYKFATIVGFTRELSERADFENVARQMLNEAAALALDAALFSTAAGSTIRPRGLLNGVTPLVATTGGGFAAFQADLVALVDAIVTAGAGKQIVLFANPRQAVALSLLIVGANTSVLEVISTPALAAGTLVALDIGSFVSGFGSEPEFEVSTESVIHSDDTTPLAIGTAGTPNTVAAPTRSLWQTDCIALKMRLRCSWEMRASDHVAFVTGATW